MVQRSYEGEQEGRSKYREREAPRASARYDDYGEDNRKGNYREREAPRAQRGYRDYEEEEDSAYRASDPENGRRYNRDYSEEDAQIVDRAKALHKDTTATTSRALRSVQQTRELAANTAVELEKQGRKLDTIDRDLQEIDTDVQEGRSLMRFMNRCCCCFICACCCGGCDQDALRDKTRKQPVTARKAVREYENEMTEQAQEKGKKTAPEVQAMAAHLHQANDEDVRGELFDKPQTAADRARARRDRSRGGAYRIGEGLADRDKEDIYNETVQQEKNLDEIDAALGDIKNYSEAMGEELGRQQHKVVHLQNHVEDAGANISNAATRAKKDFRLKGKSLTPSFQAPSAFKVASSVSKMHSALR